MAGEKAGERRTVARGDRCRDKRFRGGSIRIQHLAHASTPEPYFRPVQTPWKAPPAGVISIDLQSKGGHRWYQTSHAYVYTRERDTRAYVCMLHGEWCRLTHFIHHLTFVISIPHPHPYFVSRTNRSVYTAVTHEEWIIFARIAELSLDRNWKFLEKKVESIRKTHRGNVEITWNNGLC